MNHNASISVRVEQCLEGATVLARRDPQLRQKPIAWLPFGETAAQGAKWYAKRVEDELESEGTEMQEVPEIPVRAGSLMGS